MSCRTLCETLKSLNECPVDLITLCIQDRFTKQHTLHVVHISVSCSKGQHDSILWLVNCVEFVSWSGTFSYVTMFGHVDYAAVAS